MYSENTVGRLTNVYVLGSYVDFAGGVDDLGDVIDTATDSQLAFINTDSKAVLDPSAAIPNLLSYQLVQKRGSEVFLSAPIPNSSYIARALSYTAGAKQKMTVTITSTASLDGDRFAIKLYDETEANQPYPIERYEYVAKSTDTATEIATGIYNEYVKQENNIAIKGWGNPSKYTITNPSAGVLVIESKDERTNFKVLLGEDTEGTIVTTTLFSIGSGSANQVYQLEKEGDVQEDYKSLNTSQHDDWGKPNRYTNLSATYDIIIITDFKTEKSVGKPLFETSYRNEFVIAIPTETVGISGSATFTALKTLLGL